MMTVWLRLRGTGGGSLAVEAVTFDKALAQSWGQANDRAVVGVPAINPAEVQAGQEWGESFITGYSGAGLVPVVRGR